MIRAWLFLLTIGSASGCSDLHYLRAADAAYAYAVGIHDAECVHVKRVKDQAQYQECEAERTKLLNIKRELDATNEALIKGPLPKPARARLKAIPKELE